MKQLQKVALFGLTLASIGVLNGPISSVYASEVHHASVQGDTQVLDSNVNVSGVDIDLVNKVASVGSHIQYKDNGVTLTTDLSNEDLKNNYGFSDKQLVDFHAILDGTYAPPVSDGNHVIQKRSNRFYISNNNLKSGVFAVLSTAAAAGPAALQAAWIGVSASMGPVAGIAGGIVGVLGTGFFIGLAAKITGAIAQNKGIALYGKWDFPPLEVKIE